MGKKLKRDFKERQSARIEKERLQSNGSIEPEENKLKHNDDYRGKIVHDKDRFQDKVHEKVSKRSAETELNGKTSKRNARYRASDKDSVASVTETEGVSQKEIGKADYDTEVKDGKIYDPLGKDLDNDGIIDRYDNDFRDSDYFESTYDVDALKKDEISGNPVNKQKAQKKNYKRKTIPISYIPEKRTKKPKRKRLTIKKAEKKPFLIEKRKTGFLKNRKELLGIRLLRCPLYQDLLKEVKP